MFLLIRSEGWRGLVEEVEMDVKRLARRNLGRDDRYVSDLATVGLLPNGSEDTVCGSW